MDACGVRDGWPSLTHYFGIVGMPLALACSEWIMAILGSWLLVRAHQKTAKAVV